jgi:N-sulfoglucosamine sulfohydrolase
MREIGVIASVLCVLACALADGASAHQPPAPATRPNILWILIEDASPDIGAYGDRYARTPRLDRLAQEGVRFTRAFSTAPVCAPSRSTLFAGMYASSIGTLHMRSTGVPPPYVKGVGEYLRAAGYFTLNRSKTDYNLSATPTEDNNGGFLSQTVPLGVWDESGPQAHWRHRAAGQPFFAVISPQVTHESRLFRSADEFAKEAVHLKVADRHDPAGAVLPPYYPDTPVARANWARYYDAWTEVDGQIADLLAELDRDGLTNNTIVFFASDHGRGFPRAKRWVYDSGIRVPFIVRWPGHLAAGSVREDLISFIDLPPTTLSLAGVAVPKHFQGQIFLGPDAARARDYVYVHRDRMDTVPDTIRAVRGPRYKYIRNFHPELPYAQRLDYAEQVPMLQEWRRAFADGLLRGPQLQFFAPAKPREELYDTDTDPHEVKNLADLPAERPRLDTMRAALDRWMKETGDLGLVPEAELKARMRPAGAWSTAATPVMTPAGGAFDGTVDVRITCATEGHTIVYATEAGPTPRWHLYTVPIALRESTLVRTKCGRLGFRDSDEAQSRFERRSE